MKRWPLLVATSYGLTLMALLSPFAVAAFGPDDHTYWEDLTRFFGNEARPFWISLLVLMFCQAGLAFVPIKVTRQRPVSRRSLLVPLIVAGFLVGLLVLGFLSALYETAVASDFDRGPSWAFWVFLGGGTAAWLAWTVLFYRLAREPYGEGVVFRQCKLLLKGSILELLVAVPTHVVARSRHECCAGMLTGTGLVCGAAVMLLAFGPALYFLVLARWQRLHPHHEESAAEALTR